MLCQRQRVKFYHWESKVNATSAESLQFLLANQSSTMLVLHCMTYTSYPITLEQIPCLCLKELASCLSFGVYDIGNLL